MKMYDVSKQILLDHGLDFKFDSSREFPDLEEDSFATRIASKKGNPALSPKEKKTSFTIKYHQSAIRPHLSK